MSPKPKSNQLDILKQTLANADLAQPSKTKLETLPAAPRPKSSTKTRNVVKVSPEALSKPTALNLYPEDLDKTEEVISFLRAKGCQRLSKSRIAQLALRQLKLDDETVAAFKKLPDYRDKKNQ